MKWKPHKIPYDHASYMDMAPEDKGENIRREVCLTLEQMGIFQKAHIMRKDRDRMKLIFVIPILWQPRTIP